MYYEWIMKKEIAINPQCCLIWHRLIWKVVLVTWHPRSVATCNTRKLVKHNVTFTTLTMTRHSLDNRQWVRFQLDSRCNEPLCPNLTVPNLLPNVDECNNFEIRANSCWGRDESCKFFDWVLFFLDNSKIKIWHVGSQVNKVRLYLRMTTNECAK